MERNFSQRVKDVLGYSREEAGRLQNGYISPEHIFLGILRDGSGPAIDILRSMGICYVLYPIIIQQKETN